MVFLMMLGGAAQVQPPPTLTQPPTPDVVVRARTEQAVDRFVAALTQAERGRQIARWNNHVCPRVIGLPTADAAFIEKRIAEIARSVGTPVARGRCAANIVVVATDDADGFATSLIRRHPKLFRDPRSGPATRIDTDRLRQPRPVRWISASRMGNSDYQSASRLTKTSVESAILSLEIVDTKRLDRITWRQLADYLALVAFAQPKIDGDFGKDTILSIFATRDRGERGPPRLTDQDNSFLQALYRSKNAVDAEVQRSSIRGQMKRDESKD
ncbi:hypothetical protein M0208_01805 [Sphingomonas sp. SUN019]|uniref:hypothetical protein n=1 Tax=Sphingomonas sp. SUN019 TaxID=2937788 RepID=UPI002164AFDB|nr:hypothetical protein [Sphingomonas sp. SUN019]UVO49313.1 hypothetical protein M0208_01805 [Sphingomonas sp. SUN019]